MTLGNEASVGARAVRRRRCGPRSGRRSVRASSSVLQTGQATWDEALLLFLERSGYPEETYHTFSYSPLDDDQGVDPGHLCVVTEETERVIGERRLALLRDVAAAIARTNTRTGSCCRTVDATLAVERPATCRSR